MQRTRGRIVTAGLVAAAVAVGAYATVPALTAGDDAGAVSEREQVAVERSAVRAASAPGKLLVRHVDKRAPLGNGRVYAVSPAGDTQRAGSLSCKQLHAAPGGAGLCLRLDEDQLDYEAVLFDAGFRVTKRFPIAGVPDRARVSRDGRYGAYTAFDTRSSIGYFASASEFTTFTRIVDMRTGKVLLRLEDLAVTYRGRLLEGTSDENFWGVTFVGRDRYYATGAVAGGYYLIEGRVGSRRARTVRAGIECPSLSPDGTRIAYKRRIGEGTRWRLHVLDIVSGRDVALAERRSIDDQPEWLGADRIVYSDDRSVFTVPADGSGRPVKLVGNAASPVSPQAAGLP